MTGASVSTYDKFYAVPDAFFHALLLYFRCVDAVPLGLSPALLSRLAAREGLARVGFLVRAPERGDADGDKGRTSTRPPPSSSPPLVPTGMLNMLQKPTRESPRRTPALLLALAVRHGEGFRMRHSGIARTSEQPGCSGAIMKKLGTRESKSPLPHKSGIAIFELSSCM